MSTGSRGGGWLLLRIQRPGEMARRGTLLLQFTSRLAGERRCPLCGSPLYYVRRLGRYYCLNCKNYV